MSLGYEEGNRTVDLSFCERNVVYIQNMRLFFYEKILGPNQSCRARPMNMAQDRTLCPT